MFTDENATLPIPLNRYKNLIYTNTVIRRLTTKRSFCVPSKTCTDVFTTYRLITSYDTRILLRPVLVHYKTHRQTRFIRKPEIIGYLLYMHNVVWNYYDFFPPLLTAKNRKKRLHVTGIYANQTTGTWWLFQRGGRGVLPLEKNKYHFRAQILHLYTI